MFCGVSLHAPGVQVGALFKIKMQSNLYFFCTSPKDASCAAGTLEPQSLFTRNGKDLPQQLSFRDG